MPAAIWPRATIFSRWAIRIRDIFSVSLMAVTCSDRAQQVRLELLVIREVLPDDDMPERRAVQSRDRAGSGYDELRGRAARAELDDPVPPRRFRTRTRQMPDVFHQSVRESAVRLRVRSGPARAASVRPQDCTAPSVRRPS